MNDYTQDIINYATSVAQYDADLSWRASEVDITDDAVWKSVVEKMREGYTLMEIPKDKYEIHTESWIDGTAFCVLHFLDEYFTTHQHLPSMRKRMTAINKMWVISGEKQKVFWRVESWR